MNIFNHPKINRVYDILSEIILIELKDFENYCNRHKKKLEIVQRFIIHWNSRHLTNLKNELLNLENLTFLDYGKIKKDIKYDKKTLNFISEAIEQESDHEIRLILAIMLDRMKLLNNIYIRIRRILLTQIEWIKDNEDSVLKEHQNIRQFLRLIKEESFLLYEHNLSGLKNERQLLKEIYDQIMPLKERITIKKLDEGAVCAPLLIEPKIAGRPYVFKKYAGSKDWLIKLIKRGLTLKEAKQRKKMLEKYYNYFRMAGINVSPRSAINVIKYGKNNYQVAMKEAFIEHNVEGIFRSSINPKEVILDIYEKILDIAYKDIKAGNKYLSDFYIRNFCYLSGQVYYIDTDPPLYQFMDEDGNIRFRLVEATEGHGIFKELLKQRHFAITGQSELNAIIERNHNNLIYRLRTPIGKFLYILVWSILIRPNMEDEFKQVLLNYLKKKRLDGIYKYFIKYLSTPRFKAFVELRKGYFKPKIQKIIL